MDAGWYNKAVQYWDKQEASYNGVLGGFGFVSEADVHDSEQFLHKVCTLVCLSHTHPLSTTQAMGAYLKRASAARQSTCAVGASEYVYQHVSLCILL